MLIIAGLGNPGPKYQNNRHNIGFMAVDAIADEWNFGPEKAIFQAKVRAGEIPTPNGPVKALAIKPQTYMNESGRAVGEAMRFYKLAPKDIVAIYDELDLAPGKARIKVGGGHGGHNGIKSLDAHCGKEYRRLRLGIGHPGAKELVTNHVLGDFAKADHAWLDPLLDELGISAAMLVRGEDSQLMNKLALATGSKPEEKAQPAKPAGQSHIRQARNHAQPKALPTSGPMADMLKKLFGDKDK